MSGEVVGRLGKASALTFVAQALGAVLTLVSSILLARGLGPAGRGAYALMVLIVLVLARLGSLGIEVANVYHGANRRHPLPSLVGNSLVVAIGAGLLLMAFSWGISRFPGVQYYLTSNDIPYSLLYVVLGTIPLTLISWYLIGLLQGRERVVQFNAVNLSFSGLLATLLVLLLVLLRLELRGVIWSYALATLISTGIALYFVQQIGPLSLRPHFGVLRDTLNYAGKAYVGNLIQFLNYRLDQFLVGYFLGPAALGLYVVAVGINERFWLMPQSIAMVLFPRTSASGEEQANLLTPKVARNVLALLIVLVLGLALMARLLITFLFGNAFEPAVLPLLWLLPGTVALGYGKILMSDLAGRGRPEIGLMASSISLGLTLLLDLYLIPRWGIVGAAAASSASYLTATLVIMVAFIRVSDISAIELLIIKASDFRLYAGLVWKVRQYLRFERSPVSQKGRRS